MLNPREGILAMETLAMKVGCPVMLLRNLSSDLVNGTLGQVTDVNVKGPVVHFFHPNLTILLDRYTFTGNAKTICYQKKDW